MPCWGWITYLFIWGSQMLHVYPAWQPPIFQIMGAELPEPQNKDDVGLDSLKTLNWLITQVRNKPLVLEISEIILLPLLFLQLNPNYLDQCIHKQQILCFHLYTNVIKHLMLSHISPFSFDIMFLKINPCVTCIVLSF